jgi:hypothetical protein
MSEKGCGISRRNLAQRRSDRLFQRLNRSSTTALQDGLDFGECQLNWREVGRIGRQKPESAATRGQQLANPWRGMGTQIIDQDGLPTPQRWAEHVLNIGGKGGCIGATRDAHTRAHPAELQRCDDRLIRRCVAWHPAAGARPNRRPAIAARQIQITAEFIHDHQIVCVQISHLDLKVRAEPRIALTRGECLFFRDQRRRAIARLIVQRLSERPCSRFQILTCSGKVASGVAVSWMRSRASALGPIARGRPVGRLGRR